MAHLAAIPLPDPEMDARAWALHCGAVCGCREPLGRILARRPATHEWDVVLDDHYQPTDARRPVRVYHWVRRIRRAKLQPWATGTAMPAGPDPLSRKRQRVIVQDMRSRDAVTGRPVPAGQQFGPLGGTTLPDVTVICPHGHHNHLTVAHIEAEVARLAEV
jgi:hypothetical protein